MMVSGGLIYAIFFEPKRLIPIGMLECYAVGTFAMILNDVVRTFVIGLPVSISTAYFGGSGEADLIFQFGIFMVGAYSMFSAGLAIWRRNLIEKLVGVVWADRFWTELRR